MEPRIPTEQECHDLMAEVGLATAVVQHSILVKNLALKLADDMEKQGIKINRSLLSAAALLHDIMKLDAEVCHGLEGGEFLRTRGFHAVAKVIETHCLINLDVPEYVPKTPEEKLLMYSDLRVNAGGVVSLEERFDYIKERYKPKNPAKLQEYMAFARQLEWELFGKKDE
ncbi:MAG: HDIG domain-containing metalloprotein [Candidatus Woesearchaeota archaeon]